MSAGKHGLQPDSHDHFYCEGCNAHGVHADPETLRRTGEYWYDAHPRKGSTVACLGGHKRIPVKYLRRVRVPAA